MFAIGVLIFVFAFVAQSVAFDEYKTSNSHAALIVHEASIIACVIGALMCLVSLCVVLWRVMP